MKKNYTIKKQHILNERIKAKEVRLIGSEGDQLGIVPIEEAKRLSSEQNLDLLLISSQATPPVCKIVNYGQYMYKLKKKEKQSKKSVQVIKELKMSHKISIHDYNVRLKQAKQFLGKKYKVKVTITFRGREVVYRDQLGVKILERFIGDLEEYGIKDNDIVKSARNLAAIINPK